MSMPPCGLNCPDRSITCHGTCEKYKSWRVKFEEEKKEIRRKEIYTGFINEPFHLGRNRKPKNKRV